MNRRYLKALKKEAYLNKAIPRSMPKTRNAFAGFLKKVRKATDSNLTDTASKKTMKRVARNTVNSAALHPDVGALYFSTAPIPGFPTTPVTAGYVAARKPIVRGLKKARAAFA